MSSLVLWTGCDLCVFLGVAVFLLCLFFYEQKCSLFNASLKAEQNDWGFISQIWGWKLDWLWRGSIGFALPLYYLFPQASPW